MNRIYKIVSYIAISLLLGYMAYEGNGDFIKEFLKNIIPLLATIVAINIPTCALLVNELHKLKNQYLNIDVSEICKEMRLSIIVQLLLIVMLVCFLIIRDFLLNQNFVISNFIYIKYINIAVNSFAIGFFIYFLEIVWDLGKALFKLIQFNIKK